MDTEPIAVGLKFGFLAVLYLFLFWVGRSALKELRSTQRRRPRQPASTRSPARAAARRPPTPRSSPSRAEGSTPASRWDLFGGLSIGRGDEADVRIEDKFASSIHCRIYSRGPSYYVEDMGSTNGTYLNGEPLHRGGAPLRPRRGQDRRHGAPLRNRRSGERAMALQIAEDSYKTDTGRQRTTNEDSYFARGPLYAVADGMGGAQAGEVASSIAAEAFEPAERGSEAARGLPALGRPEREQPDPLPLPARLEPLRHGDHPHRRAGRRRRDLDRPRRRLARLPSYATES